MKLKQFGFHSSMEEKDKLGTNDQKIIGRVIGLNGSDISVMTDLGEILIASNQVTLGDFVTLIKIDNNYQIQKTEKPVTKLIQNKQTVATNMDTIVVVTTPGGFNLDRFDACLNQAWDSGALPVIALVNKEAVDVSGQLLQMRSVAAFVDIFIVDDVSKDDKLKHMIKDGKTTLLMGDLPESKTYLLNKLFNQQYDCQESQLFLVNHKIIMNLNVGTSSEQKNSVDAFDDVETLSLACRFKDCTHQSEPGCHVLESLKNGTLSQMRYDAYSLSHEIPEDMVISDEDVEDGDLYKAYERKKDKEKHKFTKKNNKEDKSSAMTM